MINRIWTRNLYMYLMPTNTQLNTTEMIRFLALIWGLFFEHSFSKADYGVAVLQNKFEEQNEEVFQVHWSRRFFQKVGNLSWRRWNSDLRQRRFREEGTNQVHVMEHQQLFTSLKN